MVLSIDANGLYAKACFSTLRPRRAASSGTGRCELVGRGGGIEICVQRHVPRSKRFDRSYAKRMRREPASLRGRTRATPLAGYAAMSGDLIISAREPPTIHRVGLTGHVGGLLRCEEHDRLRDLICVTGALERNVLQKALLVLL